MRVENISETVIMKIHCDWIINKAAELKSLCRSRERIEWNKSRALTAIESVENSLNELKAYIQEVENLN